MKLGPSKSLQLSVPHHHFSQWIWSCLMPHSSKCVSMSAIMGGGPQMKQRRFSLSSLCIAVAIASESMRLSGARKFEKNMYCSNQENWTTKTMIILMCVHHCFLEEIPLKKVSVFTRFGHYHWHQHFPKAEIIKCYSLVITLISTKTIYS